MPGASRRRAVPVWFWVAFAVWLLVYTPSIVLLFRRLELSWFVTFFALIVPIWFAVRLWVYRATKRRENDLQD